MKIIRVGSRESELAVAQARMVMAAIRAVRPDVVVELTTMKTSGDRILDRSLEAIGGKGLFVKELDQALSQGRVDLCVHSCKDMPIPGNPALPILAVPPREDPRDVLVLPSGATEPDKTRPLGTSSPRRRAQAAVLFPGWHCETVRGNIQTRLQKLDSGQYGGLLLAAAGLRRLGMADRISRVLSPEDMLPAAGQGALVVQGRNGDDLRWLKAISDPDAWDAVAAERAFVERLGGGCSAPSAAYAIIEGGELLLTGMHVDAAGQIRKAERRGPRERAAEIGALLAETI